MLCMNTGMTWQTVSTNSDATERLGELFGKLIKTPAVVELRSDLGGGKTTFVRGLAKGFGSADQVISPTFILNAIYKGQGGREIHHFDFYRLDQAGILSSQLEASLKNRQVVTVVEWSGIVQKILPQKRFTVEFQPVAANEDERQIIITYPESKAPLMEELKAGWLKHKK